MKVPHTLALEAGRHITREGKPFVALHRTHENERYSFPASQADDFAFLVSKVSEMYGHLETVLIVDDLALKAREVYLEEVRRLVKEIRAR